MEHPKDVGDRSTLAIMLALRAHGYGVYTPFGENTRCDLIIEDGEALLRVQCKTGRLINGAIAFPTCSSYLHHPHPKISHRNYVGEVDYFGVFCQETGGVYLVPIEDVPTRSFARLRVEPSRNGQHRFVRNAAPYEVASRQPRLLQDLAFALVVQDLPLDPLQRVVDRLRVAGELFGHVLVGGALEVEAQRARLE